jgi:phosphoribosylformimino-5-aminoimidazole carboxamide ribotide isomerase
MSTFEILPAIDLRAGRVVRLEQGDFGRERAFSDDPAAVATIFVSAGATWLHVVDLDGARDGERRQAGVIGSIADAAAREPEARIQVAGGLRDGDSISAALDEGASRVVLGTAAIRAPAIVRDAILRHGRDRVAIALDVRAGRAMGDGWVAGGVSGDLRSTIDSVLGHEARTFIVTSIARVGLLGGPDIELLTECVEALRPGGADVIASGGIRSIEDLAAVRRVGCSGAIVGRAFYDGRIDLVDAVRWARAGAV